MKKIILSIIFCSGVIFASSNANPIKEGMSFSEKKALILKKVDAIQQKMNNRFDKLKECSNKATTETELKNCADVMHETI